MSRKTVQIGNLLKGITPSVSDKKSKGWKIATNINQEDELGSITTRDGLVPSDVFVGTPGALAPASITKLTPEVDSRYSENIAWLSQYGNWVTNTPEIYLKLYGNFSLNSLGLCFNRSANFQTLNPGASIHLTLYTYKVESIRTLYTDPVNGRVSVVYRKQYVLSAPLATADRDVSSLDYLTTTNPRWMTKFEFNNTVQMSDDFYIVRLELRSLNQELDPSLCDLGLRGVGPIPYLSQWILRTTGLIEPSPLPVGYNDSGSIVMPYMDVIGNVIPGEYIPGTNHAVQSTSGVVFLKDDGTIGGDDIVISTDKKTYKSILPVSYNVAQNPPRIDRNYDLGLTRYGMSMVVDGETHYIALLSTLLQPNTGDGSIVEYTVPNDYGKLLGSPTCLPTDIKQTGWVGPLGNINYMGEPGSSLRYGIQYVYGNEKSEITEAPTWLNVHPLGGTQVSPGKFPVFTIPYSPFQTGNIVVNKPTGINIYRKAVKPVDATSDDVLLTTASWQIVTAYDIAKNIVSNNAWVSITPAIDKSIFTITDKSHYAVSGDYVVLPGAAYEINSAAVRILPTPGFIFTYNGRMLALGDKDNRSTVFFSKDGLTDFNADDTFTLDLPLADFCLTAGFTLGGNAYICSAHKTYRVIEVSDSIPYYKIEPVAGMDGVGCISPKSIITHGGLVYFLSADGYIAFNGSNFVSISDDISEVLDEVDQRYTDIVGNDVNPLTTDCFFAPYLVEAVYNIDDDSIYLALPTSSLEKNTLLLKYTIPLKSWSTVEVPNFKGLITGRESGVDILTTTVLLGMYATGKTDTVTGTPIKATLETYDIVIPNQSQVNMVTLYGTGTINAYVYMNRETTPKISKLGITLKNDGTDIPINRQGFEFRLKIESVTSEDFKLTAEPELTVTSSGQRLRKDVE